MKIWKGKELEGDNKGVMTLFVKDSQIEGDFIIKYLRQNPDCKRVYLGAGRVDVIEETNFSELDLYCSKNGIDIVVECSLEGFKALPQIIHENAYEIIVRFMDEQLELLGLDDVIKIDTGKQVYTVALNRMVNTDLVTLKGDVFESDVVLYDTEVSK